MVCHILARFFCAKQINYRSSALGAINPTVSESVLLLRVRMCDTFHGEHALKKKMVVLDIRQGQLALQSNEKVFTGYSLVAVTYYVSFWL